MDLRYYMRKSGTDLLYSKYTDDLPNGSRTFEDISEMLLSEPKTLLPQSPGVLEWSYQDGHAVVTLDRDSDDCVVGYTRLMLLLAKNHRLGTWLELGSTWVHPHYRGNSISKEMYKLLLPNHADSNILATSTSSYAIHVGEQLGFVPIPRRELPIEVWGASCTCPMSKTKSPDADNRGCTFARGEPQRTGEEVCWFRVTAETYARLSQGQSVAVS